MVTAFRRTTIAAPDQHDVLLRLTGERAPDGIEASALRGFLDGFLAALRDLDRTRRGAETKRPGSPEAQATAATAFRVVGLSPGSACLVLTPASGPGVDGEFGLDDRPRATSNVECLIDHVARSAPLPAAVADALSRACAALGPSGEIDITVRGAPQRRARIDSTIIRALRSSIPETRSVTSIGGRLMQLAAEPDRVRILAPDGTEWTCTFDDAVIDELAALWRRVVRAQGDGRTAEGRKGSFHIVRITAVVPTTQLGLFTETHRPAEAILLEQGIASPQGLNAVSAAPDELLDDAAEDAYLDALLGTGA